MPGTVEVGVMAQAMTDFGSVKEVATLLFTKYLYPFELTSVLLLAAIVGAVVMSKRDDDTDKIENNEAQN